MPETIHAVLVKINGIGVAVFGRSGSGKSLLALELLRRGHALIADDVVLLIRRNDKLYGTAPEALKGQIEYRGLGVIDVRGFFGRKSWSASGEVKLLVSLDDSREAGHKMICGTRLPVTGLGATKTSNRALEVEAIVKTLSETDRSQNAA